MICDQCETVAHCMKHGCVPKQPMPTKDEALKLALEALEKSIAITMANIDLRNKAITAIKQALAAPVQEPVNITQIAELHGRRVGNLWHFDDLALSIFASKVIGLTTTPPAAQRQWVGLTDEEIDSVQRQYIQQMMPGSRHFARAIEAKLKEKNTP